MSKSTISGIIAISKNHVIGKDGDLPWDIPEDLQHFRDKTKGHAMIMGRKTFESIGRVLPKRISIIVTRNADYQVEGAFVVQSIDEAIALAREKEENGEIFVIGGGEIFRQAMPQIEKLYITVVNVEIEGDAKFPDYSEFTNVVSERKSKDDNFSYTFFELTR